MATFFVESSAQVKRYLAEVGTAWIRVLLDPTTGNEIYVTRITYVELIAAITRRERGGSISGADAARARADFRSDFAANYQPMEVTRLLVEEAARIAERHALRGYDAVQLATALALNAAYLRRGLPAVTVISADVELNVAALAEGLAVDDPNAHP